MSQIDELTVGSLLAEGPIYSIPMYQRNYAWEEGEITQLIQDILDSAHLNTSENPDKPYYLGTLVVFQPEKGENKIYETIDGQQRLTTLSLLAAYLKHHYPEYGQWPNVPPVSFEHRENSRRTFESIFANSKASDPAAGLQDKEINPALLAGYRIIDKVFPRLVPNDEARKNFCSYLTNRVTIMRVLVPQDTDLNHYFEIMNNRGEQLEKHEVLKARLLKALTPSPDTQVAAKVRLCFHRIWEACSNTEKYLQMSFKPQERSALFGDDWNTLQVKTFSDISAALDQVALDLADKKENPETSKKPRNDSTQKLSQLVNSLPVSNDSQSQDEDAPERFTPISNFPNFLLHVLRVFSNRDIPLDDKRLISIFEDELLKPEPDPSRIEAFAFALFKAKYLIDSFVIKREYLKGKDAWSLKSYLRNSNEKTKGYYRNTFGKEDDDGEQLPLLMLLAALHVSTPTQAYKYWFSGILAWLFQQPVPFSLSHYLEYTESLAKAFVFDRFLSPSGSGAEYSVILKNNSGKVQATKRDYPHGFPAQKLTYQGIENNLVFNFLDYLLWKKHRNTALDKDQRINKFEFSFRSSIEHYYPQNPENGYAKLPDDVLNDFGNLCLISHSKNSRLNNHGPVAKKEYYLVNDLDSIKQYFMMERTQLNSPWDAAAIKEHGDEMRRVLFECLDP